MSKDFSEQLKRAIRESALSRYALSQATGVDQGTLSKFLAGQRGLSLDSVDKLVDALGMTLTFQKKRGAGRVAIDRPSDSTP
jgi:transcriptional regulator with XRE-family HTH domain